MHVIANRGRNIILFKVMHILNSNKYSGAENVVIEIINGTKNYCQSAYVSPYGKIEGFLRKNEIEYIPVKKLSIQSLREAIKTFNPDVIHAHDFRAGMYSCLTGTGLPIINHLHNNPPWIKRISLRTVLYACCCFRFNRILTVSNSVMDEFVFGKVFCGKAHVVGNPFNANRIRTMAIEAKVKQSSDIIFLGRISPQKSPFFFLDIIAKVKKSIPDVKVAVVGEGELCKEFIEKINEKNLQENVTMYGFLENPYGLLKNAKVMCMPSAWEGFGLAAVEALTLGTPVICSGVGGLSDIVSDINGKICHHDVTRYTDEIIKLLTNESYLNDKSKGTLESSIRFDNLEVYCKNIVDLYGELLG